MVAARAAFASGFYSIASCLFCLSELRVDLFRLLLGKLLDSERFRFAGCLHSLLFFVRRGQVAAIDHIKLLLRDPFFFQLAVSLLGVVANIGMLFLQGSDGTLAEIQARVSLVPLLLAVGLLAFAQEEQVAASVPYRQR